MTAYDGIDKNLIQMATVYSFTRKQKLKNIYLPIMLKSVLAQVGANVSFGLKIVVSAEIMCYTFESLGGAIYHAQLFVRVPQFMALVLFVVVFGAILEWAFSLLNKISERWSR
jgi:ABC-type nitrate/sulfonate/bicarbonate transport system permease component